MGEETKTEKDGTYLAQAIDLADQRARYDEDAKYLLSDRQVLAWILKYTLEEFKDMPIEEILPCIGDDIAVGDASLDPSPKALGRVQRTESEDSVPGEGRIYFDIRFSAFPADGEIKILVNVEAQATSQPSALHYHLDNRLVYYLSRMVSGQKNTEFFHDDYDGMKPVRSIWLCFDGDKHGDAIEKISLRRETVFGEARPVTEIKAMQGFFIHIRHSSDVGKSGNRLIAMLEELFSEKEAEEKKRTLKDGYGLVMSTESERRMDDMCNISSMLGVKERAEGRAEGITEGIAQGRAEGITEGITQGIAQGRTEGIAEGIMQGIAQGSAKAIISMGEDFQLSKDAILGKLQEKLGIGAQEAEEYWEKYAGGTGADR